MGYKRTGRPTGRPGRTTQEQWDQAKILLEDGASYREVSDTLGIPRTTLRENLPGYGWTAQEGREFRSLLMHNSRLTLDMWDKNRRNGG